ncbi:hypothetical protein [Rhizorhabdus sp. FW153]|uniref:hypothetical protein n=1 Tax=Rhizorhabdus sp. FW153 TaxID=3400216 RepID=UPI003CEBA203
MEQEPVALMRVLALALSWVAIVNSVPSAAQAVSWGAITVPEHTDGCELHIFPAQSPKVTDATQSPFLGLLPELMNEWFAVKNPAAIQQFMASAASLPFQIEFLRQIDYSKTLKGAGRIVLVHDKPLPDFVRTGTKEFLEDIKKRPRESSDSSSECYEEIILTVQNYTKSTIKSNVKNGFIYRKFSGDIPTYAEFGAYGRSVPTFPPKNDKELASSVDELRAVYRDNIMRILTESALTKINEKSWGKINQ